MHKTLTTLAAGLALLVAPHAALANGHYGGSIKDAPVMVAGPNWSGLYIGAALGWSRTDYDFTHDLYLDAIDYGLPANYDVTTTSGLESDGLTGTVTIGYDHEFSGRFVAGVFADFTFGNHDDEGTLYYPISGGFTEGFSLEHKTTWAIGGRLGMLVRPETLVYVNGGYTRADIEMVGLNGQGRLEEDMSGWFVGGGLVHHLRDGLGLTVEYRYSDFGEETFGVSNDLPCCYEAFDVDASNHAIRVGLTYRFPSRRVVEHVPLK